MLLLVRPLAVEDDHDLFRWMAALWVRRWLVSPIRARKACSHVGHMWVGADVAVEAALALHMARLVCASPSLKPNQDIHKDVIDRL